MDNRLYPFLKYSAIIAALLWVAWQLYDYLAAKQPGDFAYHAGSHYFADGLYDKALVEYQKALREAPDHLPAKRGQAETLIMLGQELQAITIYQELLSVQPDNAGHYANLGIAYDRIGEHRKALEFYDKALAANTEVGTGPNWLTRFLRNQAEQQPGIATRAEYLREQFKLPADQQVLTQADQDQAQRPYKK